MKRNQQENDRVATDHLNPVPLETVTRPTIGTVLAAYYLNRKPQTLRIWACLENGPIRPLRINGRLEWRVQDIKKLIGAET